MKRSMLYAFLAGGIMFSCTEKEDEAVIANFDAEVTGASPNAQIELINKSEGASTYTWTFSEGSDLTTSTNQNPVINVDKAGDISITLTAMNGASQNEFTKTVSVAGNSAISIYENLEFAVEENDEEFGRYFSFETGEMYLDREIDDNTGPKIDLAFSGIGYTMYYFDSPAREEYNIPNAVATKVNNYESNPSISMQEFDAMDDDHLLSTLEVVDTEESFGNSTVPHIVLFEMSSGRKGVIKTKAINAERLLVDIKVQKY